MIGIAKPRRGNEPWQDADGRWWLPGTLTPEGAIVSQEPGTFFTSGRIVVTESTARYAEAWGWEWCAYTPHGHCEIERA